MAKIVGGITTSHIPSIGNAMANNLQQDPYWKPLFDGYGPVKEWLEKVKPDIAIIVYNDHGLNFFLDTVPTFAMGCAKEYFNDDEGWGIPTLAPVKGDEEFSWHVVQKLIESEFDMTICQEMKVDHGFMVPMNLMWGDKETWPVKGIPLAVNTVQHPLPSASRCYQLGKALRQAIESYPEDAKVVIIGTGGLSHQLQGERAGIINPDFDIETINKIVEEPEWLTRFSNAEIMEHAGTEGIEVIMWLVMRGAMTDKVKLLHKHYHAPVSNTGAGILVVENDE